MNWRVKSVFETRLGFDHGELNIIDNMNINILEEWKGSLRDDKEIPEGPCNLRICTTLVSMVAAYTVQTICQMLVSKQKENPMWEHKKKTIISLAPELKTYTLG
jgi:hypothetical protein